MKDYVQVQFGVFVFFGTMYLTAARILFIGSTNKDDEEFIYAYINVIMWEKNKEEHAARNFTYFFDDAKRK